jgi:hypothetical protein
MKKKGLQQHHFTKHLTEWAQHLSFLVSGVHINSKVDRNYITLHYQCVLGLGHKHLGCLGDCVGPLSVFTWPHLFQLFKKPGLLALFQKKGLFKECMMGAGQSGSSNKTACLASLRPWVQTPVLPKKKKRENAWWQFHQTAKFLCGLLFNHTLHFPLGIKCMWTWGKKL